MNLSQGIKELKNDIEMNGLICIDDYIKQKKIMENQNNYVSVDCFIEEIKLKMEFDNYKIKSYKQFANNKVLPQHKESYKDKLCGITQKYFLIDEDNHIEFIVNIFEFMDSFFNDNYHQLVPYIIGNTDKLGLTDSKNAFLNLHHRMKKLFYRGHDSLNYFLLPSVYRNKNNYRNESEMYYELISQFPNEFDNIKRHIEIIRKFQHYGMPTRLLDLTSNLLVALYFAVSEKTNYDSELIILQGNENIKNNYSDTVEILSALSTQSFSRKKELYELSKEYQYEILNKIKSKNLKIDEFNNTRPVQLLLHEIRRVVGHFESIIDPSHLTEPVLVQSNLDNSRLIRQNGAFIVTGLYDEREYKLNIIKSIEKLRYNRNNTSKKIRYVIPSVYKEISLASLEVTGINKKYLFPELEVGAEYISNFYSADIF